MTGDARYLEADRSQLRWDMVDLESQLPADHRARVVWTYVSGLELGAFYARIEAREGEPGRPPADPKVLLALWLYAISEQIGSARALARLCESHDAYRWLCGGVSVNYHGLADFRTRVNSYGGQVSGVRIAGLPCERATARRDRRLTFRRSGSGPPRRFVATWRWLSTAGAAVLGRHG